MRLVLYDRARSGNCYRARLMLSLLALPYDRVPVETGGEVSVFLGTDSRSPGENRTAWFLRKNPRGQLPVLEADGEAVWDSVAILVFLAKRFGGTAWLPDDALGAARVVQWLILSQNELLYGLGQARGMVQLGRPGDLARAHSLAHAGLRVLDERLDRADWLEQDRPTIADVACFPYVSVAGECGVDTSAYAGVRAWIERVGALPGFVPIMA